MPQLQVSNKTLKLTNVLIAKMTAEDMQDIYNILKKHNRRYSVVKPRIAYFCCILYGSYPMWAMLSYCLIGIRRAGRFFSS